MSISMMPSGPVRRAASALLLSAVLLAGCGPDTAAPAPAVSGVVNDVDVMFLQMGLTQIAEGDKLAGLAVERAGNPEIKAVAGELRGQWTDESGTMERWLLGWSKPVSADPSAGVHAGHGELHAL